MERGGQFTYIPTSWHKANLQFSNMYSLNNKYYNIPRVLLLDCGEFEIKLNGDDVGSFQLRG
jgi:hypothetical protein